MRKSEKNGIFVRGKWENRGKVEMYVFCVMKNEKEGIFVRENCKFPNPRFGVSFPPSLHLLISAISIPDH